MALLMRTFMWPLLKHTLLLPVNVFFTVTFPKAQSGTLYASTEEEVQQEDTPMHRMERMIDGEE